MEHLLGFHSSCLIKLYQIGLKNGIEIITVSDSGGRSNFFFHNPHTNKQKDGGQEFKKKSGYEWKERNDFFLIFEIKNVTVVTVNWQ